MDSTVAIPDPPDWLVTRIGGELDAGWAHLERLKGDGLEPSHAVLDVGCGVGRTAIALTSYLSEQGSYEGFDPDRDLVDWCRREISSRYPNFRFNHVDIFNSQVNQRGAVEPADLDFPYVGEQFDHVVLHSVFTHMLAPGLHRYCSEIHRVLRPGGCVFGTFFLLNDASLSRLRAVSEDSDAPGQELAERLLAQKGACRTGYEPPERMVAYEEAFVRGVLEPQGFDIEAIRYGTWMELLDGRPHGTQDGILARRASS